MIGNWAPTPSAPAHPQTPHGEGNRPVYFPRDDPRFADTYEFLDLRKIQISVLLQGSCRTQIRLCDVAGPFFFYAGGFPDTDVIHLA